jgi:hypothetical protein
MGAGKVNYKQQTTVHQYSTIIRPWTSSARRSSVKGTVSEVLAAEVPTSKHSRLKSVS